MPYKILDSCVNDRSNIDTTETFSGHFSLIPGNRAGVTLVEILTALTILTFVTAALSTGTNYLTRRMVHARNAALARNLLWKRLAQVKAEPESTGQRAGDFGDDYPGWTYDETFDVKSLQSRNNPGLYDYRVTVSWKQGLESERLTYETFIYKHQMRNQIVSQETEGYEIDRE